VVAACAYCKSFIALREPFDDSTVTHGACDPCVERLLREWEALTGPEAGPTGPASTGRPATRTEGLARAGAAGQGERLMSPAD
jgi:hypothetical protein